MRKQLTNRQGSSLRLHSSSRWKLVQEQLGLHGETLLQKTKHKQTKKGLTVDSICPPHPLPHFLRQDLSLNLELAVLAKQPGQCAPGVIGFAGLSLPFGFYCRCIQQSPALLGMRTQVLHVHAVSTVPTESSPQT